MTAFNQAGQGQYTFGNSATPVTAYNDELIQVSIRTTRENVTRPATYGKPVVEQYAGNATHEMTIEYLGDPTDAGSFWSALYTAIEADGSLYFDVVFQDGPVSATNPRYTGRAMVNDFTIGAPVNEIWQQSVTYPVVDLEKSNT